MRSPPPTGRAAMRRARSSRRATACACSGRCCAAASGARRPAAGRRAPRCRRTGADMRVPGLLSGALLCALALGALRAAAAPPLCSQVTPAENVADPGLNLLTETSHTGVVDVYFQPSIGTPVTFYECVHGRAYPLGTAQSSGQLTGIAGAVPWLCGRRRRDFRATTTHDGRFVRPAASALPPTCAHRFTVTAPRRVRRGRTAAVLVSDTWGTGGIHTRLCITSPSGDRRCRRVAFAPSVSTRSVRFRAGRRGLYELALQVRRFHVRAAVAAGVKPVAVKARPVLLATGDSTMNGVAGALGDDLAEFDVAGRVYPGAELSDVAWPKLARPPVADLHPAVTVVSIGATEGVPMTSPDGVASDCCGPARVAEYTPRAPRGGGAGGRRGRGGGGRAPPPRPRDDADLPPGRPRAGLLRDDPPLARPGPRRNRQALQPGVRRGREGPDGRERVADGSPVQP